MKKEHRIRGLRNLKYDKQERWKMKLRKSQSRRKRKIMARQERKDKIFIKSVQERKYLVSESIEMREQRKQNKGQKCAD